MGWGTLTSNPMNPARETDPLRLSEVEVAASGARQLA
jgi:hypothetical protein